MKVFRRIRRDVSGKAKRTRGSNPELIRRDRILNMNVWESFIPHRCQYRVNNRPEAIPQVTDSLFKTKKKFFFICSKRYEF